MFLYHFSEEPQITIFHPRKISENKPAVVWAIDEEHAVNYFFPRDCPRIIYSRSEKMSKEDEFRFFHNSVAETIIVVETDWLDRIRKTKLYRYTFHSHSFELADAIAGYYTSQIAVDPIKIEPVGDLLGEIISRSVELRFTPNLNPLRDSILNSTIDDCSMIRFRNAAPLGKKGD